MTRGDMSRGETTVRINQTNMKHSMNGYNPSVLISNYRNNAYHMHVNMVKQVSFMWNSVMRVSARPCCGKMVRDMKFKTGLVQNQI